VEATEEGREGVMAAILLSQTKVAEFQVLAECQLKFSSADFKTSARGVNKKGGKLCEKGGKNRERMCVCVCFIFLPAGKHWHLIAF